MAKYLLIVLLFVIGCKSEETSKLKEYSDFVGDIQFNPKIDGDFERCDPYSNQYYGINGGLGYQGEMSKVHEEIKLAYKSIDQLDETGLITIRFVVNCNGQSGMFRVFSTDLELNEFNFNQRIVDQLLEVTKGLNNWKVAEYEGNTYDYYQYLTFKVVDSELKEITP